MWCYSLFSRVARRAQLNPGKGWVLVCKNCRRLSGRHFSGNLHCTSGRAVYVLHAFQKKSKLGISMSQKDVALIEHRFKTVLARNKVSR